MHRKFCLLILLIIWLHASSRADPLIDSLLLRLQRHTAVDTLRVKLLNELGFQHWLINPAKAEQYGQEALQLATTLEYVRGIAYANDVIGVAHWTQGNYTTALDYLIEALTSYQKIDRPLGAANTMLNIGLIHYEQQDYELALQFYQEALATYRLFNQRNSTAGALSNIGSVYYDMGRYQQADSVFNQALGIYQEEENYYGLGVSYSNLGDISAAEKDYFQALSYYQQSLDVSRNTDDRHGIAASLYRIGKTYRQRQRYSEAEQHLKEAVEVAEGINDQKQLQDIYLELKEVEVARGNHQRAIAYYEQHIAVKDSLFNEEKARQLAELQTVYETQQKEQEIALQSQRIETLHQEARADNLLRNGLIFVIVVLGALAYLVVSRQRIRIKKNKEVHLAQQALTHVELENMKLKEEELARELSFKSKELTSYTVNFIQKNELFEELKGGLIRLKKAPPNEMSKQVNSLTRLVDQHTNIDRDWEDFKRFFEGVHQGFFERLRKQYPDLTQGELRLCALLRLKMNLKEAAGILGISPESVKTARYRLRKKLNLGKDDNLVDFMQGVDTIALPPVSPVNA